jgi:polyhydroxyalkanoate synthesis regulator phasin
MTYKEALEIRNESPDLEHQLRSAKIVSWLVKNGEIEEEKAEDLYSRLFDVIANSDEEFDMIVYDIIDQMKEEEEMNG